MNCVPLSEIMVSGTPCSLKISLENMFAKVAKLGRPLMGTKCVCLENLSTTTRIVFIPLEGGSSTIKSMEICFQGRSGIRSGRRRPDGLCRADLL
ncbi:hypothetical protein FKM82_027290 [Ascaphus truei]